MVNASSAHGIALISGSGGAGRTMSAINLAAHLAVQGKRTLLFDLCLGWGGLNALGNNIAEYEEWLVVENDYSRLLSQTEAGFDLLTCVPPEFLEFEVEELKRIAWLANRYGQDYDYILFDPPSSGHPLALLAAGLSEQTLLFSRPEAPAIASSYCLLKSLYTEGIYSRVKTVFSMVESAEQAHSLKTRFDLLTAQFLGIRIADGGFIFRRACESLEDFSALEINEESRLSIKNIVIQNEHKFQIETTPQNGGSIFSKMDPDSR